MFHWLAAPITVAIPTWSYYPTRPPIYINGGYTYIYNIGDTVTLSCSCSGIPSPNISIDAVSQYSFWPRYGRWFQWNSEDAPYLVSTNIDTTSSVDLDGTIHVYGQFSWTITKNADGSVLYLGYILRCTCTHTPYSNLLFSSSNGIKFIPQCKCTLYYQNRINE